MCRYTGGAVLKSPPANAGRCRKHRCSPWIGKIPWRRAWWSTPVFLPGEFHGQKRLAGYSPQGHRVGHDWNDLACTHIHVIHVCFAYVCAHVCTIYMCMYIVSYIHVYVYNELPRWLSDRESTCQAGDKGSLPRNEGRSPGEGNGSPLQYSCLGYPMDRGAWQATVHGIAKKSDTA